MASISAIPPVPGRTAAADARPGPQSGAAFAQVLEAILGEGREAVAAGGAGQSATVDGSDEPAVDEVEAGDDALPDPTTCAILPTIVAGALPETGRVIANAPQGLMDHPAVEGLVAPESRAAVEGRESSPDRVPARGPKAETLVGGDPAPKDDPTFDVRAELASGTVSASITQTHVSAAERLAEAGTGQPEHATGPARAVADKVNAPAEVQGAPVRTSARPEADVPHPSAMAEATDAKRVEHRLTERPAFVPALLKVVTRHDSTAESIAPAERPQAVDQRAQGQVLSSGQAAAVAGGPAVDTDVAVPAQTTPGDGAAALAAASPKAEPAERAVHQEAAQARSARDNGPIPAAQAADAVLIGPMPTRPPHDRHRRDALDTADAAKTVSTAPAPTDLSRRFAPEALPVQFDDAPPSDQGDDQAFGREAMPSPTTESRLPNAPVRHTEAVPRAHTPSPAPEVTMQDGAAHVRLEPDELGTIDIRVDRSDGTLAILVRAERADSAEMMRRNIDLLQRELSDSGVTNARIDFGQGSGGQSGSPGRGGAGVPAETADQTPARAPPRARGTGQVDMRL